MLICIESIGVKINKIFPSIYKKGRGQRAEGRSSGVSIKTKVAGYKAQLKLIIIPRLLAARYKTSLFQSHSFKGGLPSAFCLLPSAF
jgi:hypothetical protein